jgi:hypothetical protein
MQNKVKIYIHFTTKVRKWFTNVVKYLTFVVFQSIYGEIIIFI